MSIYMSASTIMAQLNSGGLYSYSNEKTKKIVDEDKTNAQDNSSSISRSLRRLRKLDFETISGKSKAKREIKSLIDSYNDLLDIPKEKQSDDLKRRFNKLDNLLNEYSKELEEVGISRNSKNHLTFDKLSYNTEVTAEDLKTVFGTDSAFSKEFDKQAKSIKNISGQNIFQNITVRETASQHVSEGRISMANYANAISTDLDILSRLSDSASNNEAQMQETIKTYMKNFVEQYNQIFQKEQTELTEASALKDMKSTVLKHSDALKNVGIQITNSDGSLLELKDIEEDASQTSETFLEQVNKLMESEFTNEMQDASQKLFCELLSTTENNIVINSFA